MKYRRNHLTNFVTYTFQIMKTKLLTSLFLFLFQMGFAQTGTIIHGKVMNNDNPIAGIEVINLMTKSSTTTDATGSYSISAKNKDVLVFISKDFVQKELYVDQERIAKNNFTISLPKKVEQLQEVVVTSKTALASGTNIQRIIDQKYVDDEKSSPKNRFIYDGTIENGMDFVRMYKDLLKIFKKSKSTADKNKRTVEFKEYALANSDQDLFVKTLKLKPEETSSFLAFCDADPQSKVIAEKGNILDLLDFMYAKSLSFKNEGVTSAK